MTRDTSRDTAKITYSKIYRWDPESGKAPYLSVFPVPRSDCGPTISDALVQVKNKQDSTSTSRRPRREGICGSCAMNINGTNASARSKPIDEASGSSNKAIKIYPSPHTFVVKDSVPDLTNSYAQHKSIEPWLQRSSDASNPREHFQSKQDRLKSDGLYECIPRACCSTSCPSYRWNSDKYPGPAILSQAYRWIIDSRDTSTEKRLNYSQDPFKLYRCHTITNRSRVCPKNSNPGFVVARLKNEILSLPQLYGFPAPSLLSLLCLVDLFARGFLKSGAVGPPPRSPPRFYEISTTLTPKLDFWIVRMDPPEHISNSIVKYSYAMYTIHFRWKIW